MSTTLSSPEKTPTGSVVRSSWKVRVLIHSSKSNGRMGNQFEHAGIEQG